MNAIATLGPRDHVTWPRIGRWLASLLVVLAVGCTSTEEPAPQQSAPRETTRSELVASMGREPDSQAEFQDGKQLLVWRFEQLWSELSPPRFTCAYVLDARGVVCGGARLDEEEAPGAGITAKELDELLGEGLPPERARQLLEPLVSKRAPGS